MSQIKEIYGLPGIGLRGKDGSTGNNGYTMTIESTHVVNGTGETFVQLSNGEDTVKLNSNFKKYAPIYKLGSFDYNVYKKEENNETKYLQFNYSITTDQPTLDDLRIEVWAYTTAYDGLVGSNFTVSALNNNSAFVIMVKDFDEMNISTCKTNVVYGNKLKGCVIYGYVRINQFLYKRYFLGIKEFN